MHALQIEFTKSICRTNESLALSVILPTNTVVVAFISATDTGYSIK